jgi:hypothetical protein
MEYTHDEIHYGQKKVNGQLCRVDWRLIQALRVVYEIFESLKPPVRLELLENLKTAIKDADDVSVKVADIRPPGCEPELRENGDPSYTSSGGTGGQTTGDQTTEGQTTP